MEVHLSVILYWSALDKAGDFYHVLLYLVFFLDFRFAQSSQKLKLIYLHVFKGSLMMIYPQLSEQIQIQFLCIKLSFEHSTTCDCRMHFNYVTLDLLTF